MKSELRKRKIIEFLQAIRDNKMALTGSIILGIFILAAVFGSVFIPFSPLEFGEVD